MRGRILSAALREFGRVGFAQATTRAIAQGAGVTLPALQYYFGGKEGLYRACADQVAQRFAEMTREAAARAAALLAAEGPAEALRAELKHTIGAVARAMTTSEEAALWSGFVARELADPGPAFAVMHEALWAPGIALVAAMIARLRGLSAPDEAARIRAMLLISSLTAFQSGREVAMRVFGWSQFGEAELAPVLAQIEADIDRL